ncbi:hypothetical protein NM688_g8892 [Phlebia brevispora]|uniref:Uncharacterized protein n=1 Tax=Phlebia brevispora TaxID=194682 RepID=A0ACC1RMG4_9APHY|nr:hypothetical protein NM688_g8892 [Phlebia brevispora]
MHHGCARQVQPSPRSLECQRKPSNAPRDLRRSAPATTLTTCLPKRTRSATITGEYNNLVALCDIAGLNSYHRVMPFRWLKQARLSKLRATSKATIAQDTNVDDCARHVANKIDSGYLPTTAPVPTWAARPLTNLFYDAPQDTLTVILADNPTVPSSPTIVEVVIPENTHRDGASAGPPSSHDDPAEGASPTALIATAAFAIWLNRAR